MANEKRPLLVLRPAVVMPFEEDDGNWVTQEGEVIPYKDISDKHLEAIIVYMDGKPGWRKTKYPYIIEEKRRRLAANSKAGKILYGRTEKGRSLDK